MIVVAAMFITAEYRRGLIRITLAASPRRGRVLAAKAIVIGSVTFVAGLAAAAAAVIFGAQLARGRGSYVYPVPWLTELRVIVGTAALLAVAAVLALAVGTMLRRSAAAVTIVIVVIVLPYILGVASVLPVGACGLAAADHPGRRLRHPAGHTAVPAGHRPLLAGGRATSRWRRGPASPCCAPTPRSPWAWPSVLLRRRDA